MAKILQNLQHKRLVLASQSPRRQQLIKELGLPVEVRLKPVEEEYPTDLDAHKVAAYLADLKAMAFDDLTDDEVLLTGDTTVVLNGRVLNKPVDHADAFRMLRLLSGETHEVVSGVCIRTAEKKVVFDDCTRVTFAELTDDEITYYIETCRPFDKAGAYGAQDFIGHVGIERMEGSFYTVMGFPMHLIYRHLTHL
jgi:septum formation protein